MTAKVFRISIPDEDNEHIADVLCNKRNFKEEVKDAMGCSMVIDNNTFSIKGLDFNAGRHVAILHALHWTGQIALEEVL